MFRIEGDYFKQWRLVFTWSGKRGEAQGVYLDNHEYR